jgi:hypothetical protein
MELLKKPESEVCYVMCSVATFSLGLLMPYIRNTTTRKIYSTTIGICISFFFIGANNWL